MIFDIVLGLIDFLTICRSRNYYHHNHTIIKIKYKKIIRVTMLQTFSSSKYKNQNNPISLTDKLIS